MSTSSAPSSIPMSILPPAPTTQEVTFSVGPSSKTPECLVCKEIIGNDEKGNKEIPIRVEYIKPWKYSENMKHQPKFFAHCQCFVRDAFRLQDEKSVDTKNAYRKREPCQPYIFHNLDEEIQGLTSYPQLRSIFQPLVHSINNASALTTASPSASLPSVSTTAEVAAAVPTVEEQKQLPSALAANTSHYQPINAVGRSLHRTPTTLKTWFDNGVKYHRGPDGHGNYYVDPVSARCMHMLHALGEKRCVIVSCEGAAESPDDPMVIQCTLDDVPITVTIEPTPPNPADTSVTASTDQCVSPPVVASTATSPVDVPATATASAAATPPPPPPPSQSEMSATKSKTASVAVTPTVNSRIPKPAAPPATMTPATADGRVIVKQGSASSVKPVIQKRRVPPVTEIESDSDDEDTESKSEDDAHHPKRRRTKSTGVRK